MLQASGMPGKLMIVGDYPTKSEMDSNNCFGAATGSILDQLLKPYKKNIRDIYATYLIKQYVPQMTVKSKRIKEERWLEAWNKESWSRILTNEIAEINPNAILIFGEKTLNTLTGEYKISQQRGSILNLHPVFTPSGRTIKVVPTYSPRDIFTDNYRPMPICQWDIGKWMRVSEIHGPFKTYENIWICKNAMSLQNWWIDRGRFSKFLTFDIETHHEFITCISFCGDGKEAFSVPLIIGNWDFQERGMIYKIVKDILASGIPKVNQNIKYDWMLLERFGFKVNNIIGDTMLMGHTIYPELPKGLDFLNSIYTDIPYYKDEGKDFDPKVHDYDRLLLYNAKDSLVTWMIWEQQQEDAKHQRVFDFFHKRVMPTFFIYKKMDEYGMQVDDEKRKKLLSKYEPLFEETVRPLKLIAEDREFNVESPMQVGKFIYETLGIKAKTKTTDSGKQSYLTDEKTLDGLVIKEDLSKGQIDCLKKILLSRKINTIIQFLNNPLSLDNRSRYSSKLSGTKTGRTSGGKALFKRYSISEKGKIEALENGWSFQTIPKHGFEFGLERLGIDLRSIYVPSPGFVFVDGDQSQAEARVVCVLAEAYETLALFDTTDIHKVTASWVTGKPVDQITKLERQFQGKTTRHAGNYNESPGGLQQRTHKSYKECAEVLSKFHAAEPKLRGIFHTGIRELVSKKRYLVSPHGRRRDFFGNVNEDMFKEAFANIPQATVSDHSKQTVMVILDEKYSDGSKVRPICEMHDGITYEVKKELAEQFCIDFGKAISTPINFSLCSMSRDFDLVIPGELSIAEDNWKEGKDYKINEKFELVPKL